MRAQSASVEANVQRPSVVREAGANGGTGRIAARRKATGRPGGGLLRSGSAEVGEHIAGDALHHAELLLVRRFHQELGDTDLPVAAHDVLEGLG